MALQRTNTELDGQVTGQTPDAGGDDFLVPDYNRDMAYTIGKPIETMISVSSDPTDDFQIISGGLVTDGGSGTIDISAGVAIGKDASGNHKIIEIPALTAVTLPSGWNDARNIWVIGEHLYVTTGSSRTHDETSESYNFTMLDSYLGSVTSDDLLVDADPTGSQVVWGKFQMNGTAFTSFDSAADGRSQIWTHANSEYFAHTHAGYGSTNTVIPYYSTVVKDVDIDDAWTIDNSSTLGWSLTANKRILVHLSCSTNSAVGSGNGTIGISLNSSELTTSIFGISNTDKLDIANNPLVAGQAGTNTTKATIWLDAGDVLRPHTEGSTPASSTQSIIRAVRLA